MAPFIDVDVTSSNKESCEVFSNVALEIKTHEHGQFAAFFQHLRKNRIDLGDDTVRAKQACKQGEFVIKNIKELLIKLYR